MRIEGTLADIDVNSVPVARADLARLWKSGELLPEKPPALQYLVNVRGALGTSALAGLGFGKVTAHTRAEPIETALNYQEN
jgi:hypothetical protein